MSSVVNQDDEPRNRRRIVTTLKGNLRELRNQLSIVNRQVGGRLELRDVDMDCVDLINRDGPISPSELARSTGLHPATLTGILDRLERAGWVVRERSAADRRAVAVRALPDRNREMYGLFSGMDTALDDICDRYTIAELELITNFLKQTTAAGLHAATALADDSP